MGAPAPTRNVGTSGKEAQVSQPPAQREDPVCSSHVSVQPLHLSTSTRVSDTLLISLTESGNLHERQHKQEGIWSTPPSLWDGSWQCADSSTHCTSDVGASKHPVPDEEGLLLRKNGGLPSLQQPECPLGTDFRQPCSS